MRAVVVDGDDDALRAMPEHGRQASCPGVRGRWGVARGSDRELLVGVGEVPFDGPGGDEQVLGDFAVGEADGG
jgi:hypothetical protein